MPKFNGYRKHDEKAKVLIVEDDAAISHLTAMYLDIEGFHTRVIDEILAAISAIKSDTKSIKLFTTQRELRGLPKYVSNAS
ncbi:response regulator transcription factor [Colwellia sp. 12G3]|uniref:response regulator transcription factor n=1 Tax=Colwellia sp. 12G3 TaxID=2058299 RepID=UPI000C3211B1|nr:response regulator transcription factor [Colwellia sp. 12G3]PKI16776.1 hypothetical protein CXF71_05840 [Colwellia sp. 12G3]